MCIADADSTFSQVPGFFVMMRDDDMVAVAIQRHNGQIV